MFPGNFRKFSGQQLYSGVRNWPEQLVALAFVALPILSGKFINGTFIYA